MRRQDIISAPLTAAERHTNFDMARALASDDRLPAPLLLLKPLDPAAGGFFHDATQRYGDEDVFMSTGDPGYQLIRGWIDGETAQPDCHPTEAVGP